MSKAFDLVDHKILATKIKEAGCRGKVLVWLKSCLENRKQRVRIGVIESGKLKLKNGSLRETAFCPALFIMYNNDLEEINFMRK